MLVTIRCVDIREAVATNQPPEVCIRRKKTSDVNKGSVPLLSGHAFEGGVWQVVANKLSAKTAEFTHVGHKSPDGLVRIPLFAYDTREATAEVLVQLGMQLSSLLFGQRPAGADQLLVIQGNVFARSDGQNGYRVWLGFAFQLEKK